MFFIPGIVIQVLTFPGVIIHELAHMLFCKWRNVAILEVVYFSTGNPAGYVIHEKTPKFLDTWLISMGPFFVNTILCLLICLPAYMPFSYFDVSNPISYFLMWLGISIGMHAIPSTQDANNVWDQAKVEAGSGDILAIISFPILVVIYIANVLRFIWADLAYGAAIGIGIPSLILG